MKILFFFFLLIIPVLSNADALCFSPVKEKEGDKSTKRSFLQSFDYQVQVDSGPIIKPSETESTKYEIATKSPLVKIILSGDVVESFYVKSEWLEQGRNCIYFKNLYETWSVVEKWQAKKLCKCN